MPTLNIIKHSYIRASENARGRARAHVRYIQHRPGKDLEGSNRRAFFSDDKKEVSYRDVFQRIDAQPAHGVTIHKLILSPVNPDVDLQEYTRHVMYALSRHTGNELEWYAVEHHNTAHPHCHVVVMGRDALKRPVFFRKDDYALARKAGDEYVGRGHNRWPSKGHPLDRAVRWARDAALAVWQALRGKSTDQEMQWRLQDLVAGGVAIGELPPEGRQERVAFKRKVREAKKATRIWRDYAHPISIDYGQSGKEPVTYSWRSSLQSLRELEREFVSNDPFVRRSVSQPDFERLQLWIKHRWRDDRRLQEEASRLERFELHYAEGDSLVLDRSSDPDQLRQLLRMHERTEVFLQDVEVRAVELWIQEADKPSGKQPQRESAPPENKERSVSAPKPSSITPPRRRRRMRLPDRDRNSST
jgi:hypothetical protein